MRTIDSSSSSHGLLSMWGFICCESAYLSLRAHKNYQRDHRFEKKNQNDKGGTSYNIHDVNLFGGFLRETGKLAF